MFIVTCPDCGYKIERLDPAIGDRFTCPDCWADLEITDLNPLQAAWFEFTDSEDDQTGYFEDDDEEFEDEDRELYHNQNIVP